MREIGVHTSGFGSINRLAMECTILEAVRAGDQESFKMSMHILPCNRDWQTDVNGPAKD